MQQYPTYHLKLDTTSNDVSAAIEGAILLTIPSSTALVNALNAGQLPPALVAALSARNLELASTAQVGQDSGPGHWLLTQIPNASNVAGYSKFAVVQAQGAITVFGAELLTTRLGPDNKLQLVTLAVSATSLTPDQLGPYTICPNQTSYSANCKQGISWTEMMTAVRPPVPPVCVPNPDRWCSSEVSYVNLPRAKASR